jgi:hypothetical protein
VKTTRGYALPLVMMLLLILGGLVTTLVVNLEGSIAIGESALHRRQAFHMAEGIQIGAIELAAATLRTLPITPPNVSPAAPGYQAALDEMLADQTATLTTTVNAAFPRNFVSGYEIIPIVIEKLRPAEASILSEGPFSGMQAQIQRFDVTVEARRQDEETPATVQLTSEVARATISLFQFYVFSNEYLDLDPGAVIELRGRIHTNGDLCIAGQPKVDTITSARRILFSRPNSDGKCRRTAEENPTDVQVATNDSFGAFAQLTIDHRSSESWLAAETTYNRHVLDSAHGVAPLRLPVSGQPRVQAGANVLAMEATDSATRPVPQAKEDNQTSLRFLVDPLLTTEPEDVQRQKFAYKADIRIIDGVWFLRKPDDPSDIGIPIWSDHVGSSDGGNVYNGYPGIGGSTGLGIVKSTIIGQENVRTARVWGTTTPQRYSPYAFVPGMGANVVWAWDPSSPSSRAVVSYGVLHRQLDGSYVPGTMGATGTAAAGSLDDFLQGARSGFKNGWIEARSESSDPDVNSGASPVEVARSRILPLNFDVAAFIAALNDTSSGELGSYFSSGRVFNGVVYISATWPGSMDGLSNPSGGGAPTNDGFARLWPPQPVDATAPEAGLYNKELPMPLCGDDSAHPIAPPIVAPPCATATANLPFVNFVRVVNAQHLSPASSTPFAGVTIPANALPTGLTIATNLPIAVVGHANVDTVPRKLRGDPPGRFVPFLVAGDRFHRHSVAWSDFNARWNVSMNANTRPALNTTQHLEILAGWNPTPSNDLPSHDHSSDGVEDFPRYNESWTCNGATATSRFFGSIVVGFASVYERTGANNTQGHPDTAGYTTCFPIRDEGFDFNLEDPVNQPPGAPLILAQSISFVARR